MAQSYVDQSLYIGDVLPQFDEKSTGTGYFLTKSAQVVYFRDTGISIGSSSDGVLAITSDTTIALSGAVTMSSTLTMSGKINLYAIGSAAAVV